VSDAYGVTGRGEVVGYSDAGAWYYTPAAGMVSLYAPPYYPLEAFGVSDNGQIVGVTFEGLPFSYTPHGGVVILDNLPGGRFTEPSGVNNTGQIVGYGYTYVLGTGYTFRHAFSYTPQSGMTDLGTLPGDTGSQANAVNDKGEIVGASFSADGKSHAVLWEPIPPPSVTITVPANGAVYSVDERVTSMYTCAATQGESPSSCAGPVAAGQYVDTHTPGTDLFTVVARDSLGQTGSRTVSYTVAAPPSVRITAPASGATYRQDQVVAAAYSCSPGQGTGLRSCAGPVRSGEALDTRTLGTHTFTVTATDGLGQIGSATVRYLVSRQKVAAPSPRLAQVRQSARRWRLDNRHPRPTGRRPPIGTTFSFNLNIPAMVTFTFTQQTAGRKVGGRCVAQTKRNRNLPRCLRTTSAGAFTLTGRRGANKVRLAGRGAWVLRARSGQGGVRSWAGSPWELPHRCFAFAWNAIANASLPPFCEWSGHAGRLSMAGARRITPCWAVLPEDVLLPQGRTAAASVRVSVAGDGFAQR
jgi:probable HAF family extracellular repeat protein